jgi:hypothetical protein
MIAGRLVDLYQQRLKEIIRNDENLKQKVEYAVTNELAKDLIDKIKELQDVIATERQKFEQKVNENEGLVAERKLQSE